MIGKEIYIQLIRSVRVFDKILYTHTQKMAQNNIKSLSKHARPPIYGRNAEFYYFEVSWLYGRLILHIQLLIFIDHCTQR